jgi:hypothetical protein
MAYTNEQKLQNLIVQSPNLLPGTDETSIAVVAEFPIPTGHSIDIVGVDSEGNITLVECKLASNREIRREVVGQILAYASYLWQMDYETFAEIFAKRKQQSLEQTLAAQAGENWDEEKFRETVTQRLTNGYFRLIIVVDTITQELKQIVQYVNQQTSPEVSFLVLELGYFANEDIEIILPHVYGEESLDRKSKGNISQWDEQTFFDAMQEICSPQGYQAMERIYSFAKEQGAIFPRKTGKLPSVTGSFLFQGNPVSVFNFYEWPKGRGVFVINFEYLAKFFSPAVLQRLADRMRTIPGVSDLYVSLEESQFKKRPSLPINEILTQPGAVETIEATIVAIAKLLQDV